MTKIANIMLSILRAPRKVYNAIRMLVDPNFITYGEYCEQERIKPTLYDPDSELTYAVEYSLISLGTTHKHICQVCREVLDATKEG